MTTKTLEERLNIGKNRNEPTVSVILATKNRPKKLEKSIESVLGQTYRDFELIVVDGSDNDYSAKIVKTFASHDPRVKYMVDGGNGPAAARNIGLYGSGGRYINFHDDDIIMKPDKLDVLVDGFDGEKEDTGVVYSSHIEVSKRGTRTVPTALKKSYSTDAAYIHKKLTKGCVVDSSSAMIKRECFDKSGMFDEDLKTAEDWDMYLRIARNYKFKFIDRPLYTSYLGTDNLRFDMTKFKAANRIIREKTADYMKNRGTLQYLKYRLSTYYAAGAFYLLYVAVKGNAIK